MKRGLVYIIGIISTSLILNSISLPPSYAGGAGRYMTGSGGHNNTTQYERDQKNRSLRNNPRWEKTKKTFKDLDRKLSSREFNSEEIDREERRKAREWIGAAEGAFGSPGIIKRGLEKLDDKMEKSGFYEEQKRKANENRKRNLERNWR